MDIASMLAGSDAGEALGDAHDAAWNATDPELLRSCEVRCAQILGHEPTLAGADAASLERVRSWSDTTSGVERAALAFTEAYLLDVASLPDETVADVREHLGDEGLVNFVNALLVLEQRQRLELAWGRLFG